MSAKIAKIENPAPKPKCSICFEEYESGFRFPCGHEFCNDCVQSNAKPVCPGHQCGHTMFEHEFIEAVHKSSDTLNETFVNYENDYYKKQTRQCYKCRQHSGSCQIDRATCEYCETEVCGRCLNAPHEGSCFFQIMLEREPVKAALGDVPLQTCFSCLAFAEKKDGCDHISCAECGVEQCFKCGQNYHFIHPVQECNAIRYPPNFPDLTSWANHYMHCSAYFGHKPYTLKFIAGGLTAFANCILRNEYGKSLQNVIDAFGIWFKLFPLDSPVAMTQIKFEQSVLSFANLIVKQALVFQLIRIESRADKSEANVTRIQLLLTRIVARDETRAMIKQSSLINDFNNYVLQLQKCIVHRNDIIPWFKTQFVNSVTNSNHPFVSEIKGTLQAYMQM